MHPTLNLQQWCHKLGLVVGQRVTESDLEGRLELLDIPQATRRIIKVELYSQGMLRLLPPSVYGVAGSAACYPIGLAISDERF